MSFQFCPKCAKPLVRRIAGDMERPACPDRQCGYVYWNNPVPVLAGIVQMDDKVILIQNKGWPAEWFGLVTGYLEKDESPEEGIRRELKEELDLEGKITRLIGVYPFPQKNEIVIAYHLLASGEISLGDELQDFKPVPIDKLKPWPFATGFAVRDWLTSLGKV